MNLHIDPHLPSLREALEHQRCGRSKDAEALYRKILKKAPEHGLALQLLGVLLSQSERVREGIDCLERCVRVMPQDPRAWNNLGNAYKSERRLEDGLRACGRALALQPGYLSALYTQAHILLLQHRHDEAQSSFDQVLHLDPDNVEAWTGKSQAFFLASLYEDSLAMAQQALLRQPQHLEARLQRAEALTGLKRSHEAAQDMAALLQSRPDDFKVLIELACARCMSCDWTDEGPHLARLRERILAGESVSAPFTLLALYDDPALHQRTARSLITKYLPPANARQSSQKRSVAANKIRLAYVSADFHEHATAFLMAELFELHDRSCFELIAISYGPNDRSPMRTRLETAFDQFHHVPHLSDEQIAALMGQLGIEIAVDLKGFTAHSRIGIFALKPAPVLVNYLGYPGSLGSRVYDYVLGDALVTPFSHGDYYDEKIVQLPYSYQVNDRLRPIAIDTPTRASQGLPEQGFVFACFNNNFKIRPGTFDIWMRLLQQVEGSVLWLLRDSVDVEANLRSEAERRGVAPSRLVFAPRVNLPEHLARHRLADLFLDTLPYNAHTTTSDALWAGLPVLTCLGQAFAGRVAASLLHAVGLPELVTETAADYEARALALARQPEDLAQLRAKLLSQRDSAPLFDTPMFARGLEAAYGEMSRRHRAGLQPAAFAVPGPNGA